MNKDKKAKNPQRNRAFAAAFHYLKSKRDDINDQKDLAALIGRTEDTVSHILKNQTDVSEKTITLLYQATDYIFNLDFLRGESTVMLAEDVPATPADPASSPTPPDVTALLAAVTASKDETIAVLRSQLTDKDEIIAAKNALIATLQQQLDELRLNVAIEKGVASETGASRQAKHKKEPAKRPTV